MSNPWEDRVNVAERLRETQGRLDEVEAQLLLTGAHLAANRARLERLIQWMRGNLSPMQFDEAIAAMHPCRRP
jgi:hypothetical protein